MPAIETLDWLYENELRAYPLREAINRVSGGYTLTNNVILDAQLTYPASHTSINLTSIVVSGTNVTFNLTGGLAFTASTTGSFPQYVRLSSGSLLVVGSGITSIPSGTNTFSNVTFEPSVVYEYDGQWLGLTGLTFDGYSALTGNITLIEGYQFGILIAPDLEELTFEANSLLGTPVSCSHFGDQDNDCDSIISFINGVAPDGNNQLNIISGNGIVVEDDPTNHRIYIGYTFDSVSNICGNVLPYPTNSI